MKISDAISDLEKLKKLHGDLYLLINDPTNDINVRRIKEIKEMTFLAQDTAFIILDNK